MRKILLVLLFFFVLSPSACCAPGASDAAIIDVRSGQMLADQMWCSMLLARSLRSARLLRQAPNGVTAIDLSNATCLPGLVDVHTHLTGDPASHGYSRSAFPFRAKRSPA